VAGRFQIERRRAAGGWVLPAALVLAGLVLTALAPRPAFAWGDRAHQIITEEAVRRLPEPLQGLFSGDADLRRLVDASLAPDRHTEALKKTSPTEYARQRAAHYFDIDAVTAEPYPFAHFPRDRKAAEKEFGAKAFEKAGTAPWVADDALNALVDAMTRGAAADIFTSAGRLAHFAADLHQPFHVTKNYNGQLTGNDGIHKMFEIGLVNRYADFYAAEVRRDRTDVLYVQDPRGALFDWLIQAGARVAPILEADTAARRKTGYAPPEKVEDFDRELDDLNSERAKAYYAAFKSELEARASPDAQAMRDAAAHLAQLLYTAWVRAGKPASLSPVPAPAEAAPSSVPYWLILPAAILVLLILVPRRRPAP
jgi:hypothetical protein